MIPAVEGTKIVNVGMAKNSPKEDMMFKGEEGDWLLKFEARLIEKGLSIEDARDLSNNTHVDWDTEPEDAADEELSLWPSDG